MINEALEIRTSEASVDMDADKISKRMTTNNDSGMIRVSNSGINASKMGLPSAVNAAGVMSGVRKILDVEPIKYAIPPMDRWCSLLLADVIHKFCIFWTSALITDPRSAEICLV